MFGDILGFYDWREGARDAVKYPTMYMTPPTTKNYVAPDVSGGEIDKP